MSLHKFAEQVAAHGRGEDSLLIHMTPDEVSRLQAFAEANGRSLTINPHTGLPEAGMLSDLFKAVAPIALGAFLGPAGMGITFGGLSSAASAGLLTGGITTLATGSLSRGLMAGLGAYGGAGLAGGVANAGESLIGSAAEGIQGPVGSPESGFGATQAIAAAPKSEILSSGLGAITKSPEAPMQFAKQNLGNIAAAAAPIMAGAMVPTTTKMPENTSPAYIRQKLYDPYTQTYKSLTPVKASEWGNRSFSDAYTNPQTGEMATLQPRSPGMAGGGIVALADGGSAGAAWAAANNIDLNQNINNWIAANPNAPRATIDAEMNKYGISQDDVNRALSASTVTSPAVDYALSHGMGLADINQNIANFTNAAATKNATDAQIDAQMKQYGISNEDVARALQATGGSQGEQYAVLAGNMGLAGLNTNINNWLAANPKATLADAQAAMNAVNINEADVKRATGKSLADLYPTKTITKDTVTGGGGNDTITSDKKTTTGTNTTVTDTGAVHSCPSGYHWDSSVNACVPNVDATQRTTETVTSPTSLVTAPATTLPVGVGGTTGPSVFGGGATVNPNGTITTSPVIPGIPAGGFTGMADVRNAYTKGGGSLGYTAPAPRTMADFNQMFNTQTGDSLAAYNYLMGKGAYPIQSQAADSATGIMRPYWSAGVKYKPKFLTANKDGTVTTSTTNPNAAGATTGATGSLTSAKTIYVVNNRGESEEATLGADGNYHTSGGNSYDVSGRQLAAMGGSMGYAMGGGLGSLGSYSDGGRLLKGPGDGVSDSIPATIGANKQPARLADGEFVVPARIVSELGNGSTEAGAKKLYAMMDRVQKARGKTTGKNKVAANTRADKYLPA